MSLAPLDLNFKSAPVLESRSVYLKATAGPNFFAQHWLILKNMSRAQGSSLLGKIKQVEECNSPLANRRTLFKDLHSLLVRASINKLPPVEEMSPQDLMDAEYSIYRHNNVDKFSLSHRMTFVEGPHTLDYINLKSRNLTQISRDVILHKQTNILNITGNPLLLDLPVEMMEHSRLIELHLDSALYLSMHAKIREHIQRGIEIGFLGIREEEDQVKIFCRSYNSATERNKYGLLFYDESVYKPFSPLGIFYIAAYKNKGKEELKTLFSRLPFTITSVISMHVAQLCGSLHCSVHEELFLSDPFLLCNAIRLMVDQLKPGSCTDLFYKMLYTLAKHQPSDPLWTPLDSTAASLLWAEGHVLNNIARAADAFTLKFGSEEEIRLCVQHIHQTILRDRGNDGRSILMHAVWADALPLIKVLLSVGVDVNVKDNNFMTALHFACSLNRSSTIELLLANKADPNALDRDMKTPYDHIWNNGCREYFCKDLLRRAGGLPSSELPILEDPLQTSKKNALKNHFLKHPPKDLYDAVSMARVIMGMNHIEAPNKFYTFLKTNGIHFAKKLAEEKKGPRLEDVD